MFRKREKLDFYECLQYQRLLLRDNKKLYEKMFKISREPINTLADYQDKQFKVDELKETIKDNKATIEKLERMIDHKL